MISASFYLSIFHIIFALISFRIKNISPWLGVWSMAFIWVAIEYVKSLGLLGFPWVVLGNTQWEYLYPIQLVEFTGVFGVSFWVILLNIGILQWILHKNNSDLLKTLMIFIIPFSLGYFLLLTPKISSDKMNVTIIQPNIHLKEKWGRGPIQNIEHNYQIRACQKAIFPVDQSLY